jgi:hypothetical protein
LIVGQHAPLQSEDREDCFDCTSGTEGVSGGAFRRGDRGAVGLVFAQRELQDSRFAFACITGRR